MKKKIAIGIDPGVKTGLAIKVNGDPVYHLSTTSFWGAIAKTKDIIRKYSDHKILIRIEDPNLNPPIFYSKRNLSDKSIRFTCRIAQNVGQNKAYAKLMIEYYNLIKDKYDIDLKNIRPQKNSMTKLTKNKFNKIVKNHDGSCTEHSRDACMLIYGRA